MVREHEWQNAIVVHSLGSDVDDGSPVPSSNDIGVCKREHDLIGVKSILKASSETTNRTPYATKAHRVADDAHKFRSWPSAKNRTRMTAISGNVKAKV